MSKQRMVIPWLSELNVTIKSDKTIPLKIALKVGFLQKQIIEKNEMPDLIKLTKKL